VAAPADPWNERIMAEVAVLLSCHGTVERIEEIAAFVQRIRRGHPAPDEVVAEVRRRFETIGGSPLMRITHAQAAALEERLAIPVRAAARLWDPSPEAVLADLAASGVDRVISLPLAPQSVHVYHEAVQRAAESLSRPLTIVEAPPWGTEPALVAAFAEAIAEAHARFPSFDRLGLVLSAHSLPTRVIAMGDPYQRDFEAMAQAVIAELDRRGLGRAATAIAYQSQGMGGGDWLGPDLPTTFAELRALGVGRVLMAPIGFVAEHVETLYDIDIEARSIAAGLGISRLERMPPMNTRPAFIAALEAVARPLL
jgi:protoporphyrin/coproporphyrin ferrochelatase